MRVSLPLLSAFALVVSSAVGEERSPGTEDSDSTAPSRGLSRSASAALSAGYTYSPPKPTPVPAPEEKPKNEIVRLPDMVVIGQKPAVFSDRSLRSGKSLDAYAKNRFLSEFDRGVLNRFSGPSFTNFSTAKRAQYLMQEEQRKENIEETTEQVMLYNAAGETERASKAQNEVYSSSYRASGSSTTRKEGTWFGETR